MMAVSIHAWVEALEQAAIEVGELALGFEGCAVISREVTAPKGVSGAYLPLFGGSGESLYIGWLASRESSQALARGLLGLTANEELPPDDIADAMGEVVNILAGGLKRRILSSVHPLALGLPIYSPVPIVPLHSVTHTCLFRGGGFESHIILVHAGVNPGVEARSR